MAHGRGDAAPGSLRELLLEAQAAYATGLLAALVEDPATSQVPPRHHPLPTCPAQVAMCVSLRMIVDKFPTWIRT